MQMLTLSAHDVTVGDMVPTADGTLHCCIDVRRARGAQVALDFEGPDGLQVITIHRDNKVMVVRPVGCEGCPLKEEA